MAMSQNTYDREVVPVLRRLKDGTTAGLFEYRYAYSPKDTLADMRYVVVSNGEQRTMRHAEVKGYLDGAGV